MKSAGALSAATIAVRVQPQAAREAIVGWEAGTLRVRVTAPPQEGRANDAVAALLARALGVRASAVSVVRGARSRDKIVRVDGLTRPEVEARLS
jgi:uncharacterized protein